MTTERTDHPKEHPAPPADASSRAPEPQSPPARRRAHSMDGDAGIDRVLNAPISEAWTDPWADHLRSLDVEFIVNAQVREVLYADGHVTGVTVSDRDGDAVRTVTADHYVSALPVEHARTTWGPALRAADPQLSRCDALEADWMDGRRDVLSAHPHPVVHGHINCLDSPWSVTGIGQAQFWDVRDFPADYGSVGEYVTRWYRAELQWHGWKAATCSPTGPTATGVPATASPRSSRSGTSRESCTARRPGSARRRKWSPSAGHSWRTP